MTGQLSTPTKLSEDGRVVLCGEMEAGGQALVLLRIGPTHHPTPSHIVRTALLALASRASVLGQNPDPRGAPIHPPSALRNASLSRKTLK